MNLHGNNDIGHSGLTGMHTYSHAYIIWGSSEAERISFAEKLAASIVCTGTAHRPCLVCVHCDKSTRHIHPDIITIDRNPDARTIFVDQIRALKEDSVIIPNEAATKVYIINHAGSMNDPAQNAILKLLEEPPQSANFILLTENPAQLLPTVRSRCVELAAARNATNEQIQTRDDVIAFYRALTDSPLKLAEFTFGLEKLEKNDFIEFVDGARSFLVAKMKDAHLGGQVSQREKNTLSPDYMMKTITVLDRAKEYLEHNVSLGHINGMICAELIR